MLIIYKLRSWANSSTFTRFNLTSTVVKAFLFVYAYLVLYNLQHSRHSRDIYFDIKERELSYIYAMECAVRTVVFATN
jgi:hypothetical protein